VIGEAQRASSAPRPWLCAIGDGLVAGSELGRFAMDSQADSNVADHVAKLDPGPFLRQEGRPLLRVGHGNTIRHDPMLVVMGRYPRARASRVPVWINWVAQRISLGS
jgi:hypothetical protein